MGQRRNTNEKTSRIMFTNITTVLLDAILRLAGAMIRAGEYSVLSPWYSAAGFWQSVAATGEALEAIVDRVATRCGIDISADMVNRGYGL